MSMMRCEDRTASKRTFSNQGCECHRAARRRDVDEEGLVSVHMLMRRLIRIHGGAPPGPLRPPRWFDTLIHALHVPAMDDCSVVEEAARMFRRGSRRRRRRRHALRLKSVVAVSAFRRRFARHWKWMRVGRHDAGWRID